MISTVLLVLNFVLMIFLPLIIGRWIARRQRTGWGLFAIGAITFILSQVGHLPFNWLILQRLGWVDAGNLVQFAIFLGLSAGLFEETARYLTYRFWVKESCSWENGLMLGAGHGGVEAMLLGLIGLTNFAILFGLANGYFQGLLAAVPEEQLYLVDAQINAFFGVPASMALLGAVERVFALLFHLSASLLVMQVFLRNQLRWLLLAISWHAALNAIAVYLATVWGAVPAEIGLGLLGAISLGLIFWLQPTPTAALPLQPLPALKPLIPLERTAEALERSKYSG